MIARVVLKDRDTTALCIGVQVHKRPAAPLTGPPSFSYRSTVPLVCRLSSEIGMSFRSPLRGPPVQLSSVERDNYRDKESVSRVHCDRSRARKSADPKVRTRRVLPLSFTRRPHAADLLRTRNLSSIWIEGPRPWCTPDSPLCGPAPVSGSVIVRAAREWMFWVFVNAPSDTFECCSSDPFYIFLPDYLLSSHPLHREPRMPLSLSPSPLSPL